MQIKDMGIYEKNIQHSALHTRCFQFIGNGIQKFSIKKNPQLFLCYFTVLEGLLYLFMLKDTNTAVISECHCEVTYTE